LRFHILMGNAGAKTPPTQVIEIRGQEVAAVIQATDVARMLSLQDFLSEDEAAIDGGAGNSGTDAAKLRMKPWKVTSCSPGGFQTPSFSG